MEWNGCRVEQRRAVHVSCCSKNGADHVPNPGTLCFDQVERRLPILWGLTVLWLLTIEAAFVVQVESSTRDAVAVDVPRADVPRA